MNINRLLMATLAGGITSFLAGYLVFGTLLMGFMTSNRGSSTGIDKIPPDFIPLILGNFFMALLLAYIFERWAGINTFASGAKAGSVIFALESAGQNCLTFGTTNTLTTTAVVVNIIAITVIGAIVGGVIGLVLGKVGTKA